MKLIITSDWHLRYDLPRCRKDPDWFESQTKILSFIADEANKREADICIVGDLFHEPREPEYILRMFLDFVSEVKGIVYIRTGQHDLPYHNAKNIKRSSFGILDWCTTKYSSIGYLDEIGMSCHWGEKPRGNKEKGLYFLHQLTFENEKTIPPNVNAVTAMWLLNEYPDAKWIFIGDNHHSFVFEHKGRYVINPGCITRQHADFKDYQPKMFYVDTDFSYIEQIDIPDDVEVVDDAYLKKAHERDGRIGAFAEAVKSKKAKTLDYKDTVLIELKTAEFKHKGTKDTVIELMEG